MGVVAAVDGAEKAEVPNSPIAFLNIFYFLKLSYFYLADVRLFLWHL